jgi:uncharacterized protein involved in cysteine biosynthesis
MITAFLRALAQLTDPPVLRVVWLSLVAALVGFAGLAVGAAAVLHLLHLTGLPWLVPVIDVLGGVAVLGLAWLLFPAVVPAISSLFVDDVAAAVERRYYPGLPQPHPQPLIEAAAYAARFLLVSVLLNLLALPLYLVPGLNLVVYLLLNGYLLGRQYFEQVACRHLEPLPLTRERRRRRLGLMVAGMVISALAAIPVINLVAPVVATAFMVHIIQRSNGPRLT